MHLHRHPRSHTLGRRSLTWLLLWLVCVLPLAQSLAAWHGYSHDAASLTAPGATGLAAPGDGNGNGNGNDSPVRHASHCDLCLSAAALAGGALSGLAPGLPLTTAEDELPTQHTQGTWRPRATRVYLSRAPPTVRPDGTQADNLMPA